MCTQYATWINTLQNINSLTVLSGKNYVYSSARFKRSTEKHTWLCNIYCVIKILWLNWFEVAISFFPESWVQSPLLYPICNTFYISFGLPRHWCKVLLIYNLLWVLSSKASFLHPQSLNSTLVKGSKSNSIWTMVVESPKFELKKSNFLNYKMQLLSAWLISH